MDSEPSATIKGDDNHEESLQDGERLRFLLRAGPALAHVADLNELDASLSSAIRQFCLAANAETASLYLWEPTLGQLVLCSSYGWTSQDWLVAARYRTNQGWTGNAALEDRPRYVSDLRDYERVNDYAGGHYEPQMFGSNQQSELTSEAISLPLKAGAKRLGVLTLHRRKSQPKARENTGFVTTDPDILQEAASNMAAFVNMLLAHRHAVRELEEERSRAELLISLIAVSHDSENARVEDAICKEVAKSFDAKSVEMYVASDDGRELTWRGSFPRVGDPNAQSSGPDKVASDAAVSKNVALCRRVADPACKAPDIVATDGLIERACIPLLTADHFLGVLDLSFEVRRPSTLPSLSGPNLAAFEALARMLASFYTQHLLVKQEEAARAKEEQSRLAVQAAGAMIFQYAHNLNNFVQDVYRVSELIADADTDEHRSELVASLRSKIDETIATLARPLEIAGRISRQPRATQHLSISNLLHDTLEDPTMNRQSNVSIELIVPRDLTLASDTGLLKEAFRNLINNALYAMPDGGSLTIKASQERAGFASIVFSDSGCGMTSEEISAALRGFSQKGEHKGVGLLISSTIVQTQGGTITISSTKGFGTSVVVTLPVDRVEEEK